MIGKIKFKDILNELSKRELKLADLEKENAELKAELTKKADINHSLIEQMADLESENAELKELIKNIVRVTWGEGWNYSLDWKVKAEQFLRELSK